MTLVDPNPANTFTIAWCQMDIAWHDPEANLHTVRQMMEGEERKFDLLLLPEMWSTGFTMQPELVAESMSGPTIAYMLTLASDLNCLVTGSVVISENQKYYNRLLFCQPNGHLSWYDKRHLFSYAREDAHFTGGKAIGEVVWRGWRIRGIICYDLRFPVWSRNTTNYDLLICVANWPSARIHAWNTLLQARAIENQSYVAGLNRVGTDANDLAYPGSSGIYDYLGNCLHRSDDQPQVHMHEIPYAPMREFRSRYNFLADRDRFTIE